MYSQMLHSSNAVTQMTVGHKHNPPSLMHCAVERGEISNMFVPKVPRRQQQKLESFMPIQVEMMSDELPTSGNFPATAKMNDPTLNQQSQISDDHDHQDGDDKTSESHPFVLAPTPVQLGKALLQGRFERSVFNENKTLKNDDMQKCVGLRIDCPSIWLNIFLLIGRWI